MLAGTTIAGKAGTMPQRGAVFTSGTWKNDDGNTYVDVFSTLDAGYYPQGTSVGIQFDEPDLIPRNIVSGVNICGVTGSATVESLGGTKFASGQVSASSTQEIYIIQGGTFRYNSIIVSGLTFKPKIIFARAGSMVTMYDETDLYGIYIGEAEGRLNRVSDEAPAYVNETGFKLPAVYTGTLNWYAIG